MRTRRHEAAVAHLRLVHSGRVVEATATLQAAERRRDALLRERDVASQECALRQREGTLLQRACAEARSEVMSYVAEVQEATWRTEEAASPYGDLLELAMGEEFQQWAQQDLEELRVECRRLQRELVRTHSALGREQAEAERWRRRGLQHASWTCVRTAELESGPFVLC